MTTSVKIYFAMGVLVLVLAIVVPAVILKKGSSPQFPATGTNPTNSAGLGIGTFSGKISKVDMGCLSGGICSATINGKKVILMQSQPPDVPAGKIAGINSISEMAGVIGSFANVYAGLTPQGDYTLYGDSNYYVEVITLGN